MTGSCDPLKSSNISHENKKGSAPGLKPPNGSNLAEITTTESTVRIIDANSHSEIDKIALKTEDALLVKEELEDSTVFPLRSKSPKQEHADGQESASLNISNGKSKTLTEKDVSRHVSAIDMILQASIETAKVVPSKAVLPIVSVSSTVSESVVSNGSSTVDSVTSNTFSNSDTSIADSVRIQEKIMKGHRSRRKLLKTTKVCTKAVD